MTTQTLPAGAPPILAFGRGATAPRVAVVTGSYGAGHNSAAREIARVFRSAGCEVDLHDVVPLLPWRLGPVLRAAYYAQLRRRPESWGTLLRMLAPGRPAHGVVTRLLEFASAPIIEAVRGYDLVVTTHPFGSQALGYARIAGTLTAPAVTYLTDTSVHSLWVHPGVDLHLAIHEVAAIEARRLGGRTQVVRPLLPLDAPPTPPQDCADPVASADLIGHLRGPWVLVTGGSLGMGQLERTARDILALGPMTPVVLCGTDVRELMRASVCIVQNAGGFTSLEALASGAPVVTYRPLPGHGVANSLNLEAAGLIPWARSRADLAVLLAAARLAPRDSRLPIQAPAFLDILTGGCAAPVAA